MPKPKKDKKDVTTKQFGLVNLSFKNLLGQEEKAELVAELSDLIYTGNSVLKDEIGDVFTAGIQSGMLEPLKAYVMTVAQDVVMKMAEKQCSGLLGKIDEAIQIQGNEIVAQLKEKLKNEVGARNVSCELLDYFQKQHEQSLRESMGRIEGIVSTLENVECIAKQNGLDIQQLCQMVKGLIDLSVEIRQKTSMDTDVILKMLVAIQDMHSDDEQTLKDLLEETRDIKKALNSRDQTRWNNLVSTQREIIRQNNNTYEIVLDIQRFLRNRPSEETLKYQEELEKVQSKLEQALSNGKHAACECPFCGVAEERLLIYNKCVCSVCGHRFDVIAIDERYEADTRREEGQRQIQNWRKSCTATLKRIKGYRRVYEVDVENKSPQDYVSDEGVLFLDFEKLPVSVDYEKLPVSVDYLTSMPVAKKDCPEDKKPLEKLFFPMQIKIGEEIKNVKIGEEIKNDCRERNVRIFKYAIDDNKIIHSQIEQEIIT